MPDAWTSGDVTLYRGDCLEVLPTLEAHSVDAIITDPVWPNAASGLDGADDPEGLLRMASIHWPRLANRAVVQLGCDSDPRILDAIPSEMPFLRVCWLEYVRPHYKGRCLYTGDVAYAFGEWPPSEPGAHVIPGRIIQTDAAKRPEGHPCPRQLAHVQWLVRWFARGPVLDPFCGSGTTLAAAVSAGLPAVGIEINPSYFDIAKQRVIEAQMQLRLEGM